MRFLLWLSAIVVAVVLTVAVALPAAWVGQFVEKQTGGRLTLGDAQGTLWRGSAFVGGAAGPDGAVTPLLPGRFSWKLSPLSLLGSVDVELANPQALLQPVRLTGSWSAWQVSPSALLLPASSLAGLGAPLNTIAPSGTMSLSWTSLQLVRESNAVAVHGRTVLEMRDMSSRLSPVKPLGSYDMAMDWNGRSAQLELSTVRGALLLNGKGSLENGRFRFSGRAQAANEYEETLGSLLSLLGQRQLIGGKNTIALEFK